ncbi:MAG: hypothetical protein J5564_01330 [Clostridia bacterium]|nr:hypothetical protein [Clostridia bacterium]
MIVIGIDTSCYTTSVAAAGEDGIICSCRKLLPVPSGTRGLRQSEAVFAHIRQLPDVYAQALSSLKGRTPQAVCVSASPRDGSDSYMPVFRTGQSFARVLADTWQVPLFATTHQRGHVRAALYHSGLNAERYLALHLSGGTTEVIGMQGKLLTLLAGTMDLHAGQLMDRTGVALGLPFPAGPRMEQLARLGKSRSLLPVSMEGNGCHFSGAETRIMQWIADRSMTAEDIAAEVFSLIARTSLRLLTWSRDRTGIGDALLTGGVASSLLFRDLVCEVNEKRRLGFRLFFGEPQYAGDNAAGVALIGLDHLLEGK